LKPNNSAKKIIFLAFLLSLLFHFGSIVYVAIVSPSSSTILRQASDSAKASSDTQDGWVETKARASNFGTPVFFQDDFEPPQIESNDNSIEETNKPEQPTELEQSDLQEQIKEATEIQKPVEEKKEEIKTIQQKLPQPILRQTSDFAPPSHKASEDLRKTTAGGPKPPLTLSQLTQGFLNHVKDEGKHAIHMLGKKSGTPSDEQIKYERYLQKLSWCLQNSFSIHNDRFPPSANMNDTVQVLLALNKDGSMKHCHVSKTSGNRDLDHFTLFIFNDASTSFPPVPHYLPHDPFTITYVVMINASEENRWKLYRQ
jgi:outer membrane biosynthesis protein TonB